MSRKKIINDKTSESTVIQDAAIKPNWGINNRLAITLKIKVTTDKINTVFKYLSVDSSTATAGTWINIKGIDKDKIWIAKIDGR